MLGCGPQRMTDAVLATLSHPTGDDRRQRSGSRSRKRRKRGNIEHVHLVISLIAGSPGVSARLRQPCYGTARFSYLALLATPIGTRC